MTPNPRRHAHAASSRRHAHAPNPTHLTALALAAAALTACGPAPAPPHHPPAGPTAEAHPGGHARLGRDTFNRLAVRLNLPLYWRADGNRNGAVDPQEVVSLLFYPKAPRWTDGAHFTPAFERAYEQLVALSKADRPRPTRPKPTRRALVDEELDQGRPTLVWNDLSSLSPPHKRLVSHMLRVAALIDRLYARQLGLTTLARRIPANDPASASLFRRNWGPTCKAPKTEKEEGCTAIRGVQTVPVDLYPKDLQSSSDFCKRLGASPKSKSLLSPFVVVRRIRDRLSAVPYARAYRDLMEPIAQELEAAARDLADPREAPLRAYLTAAAKAFRSNQWQPADEAWARMNATNSRWYIRVAPDEVYWEPCSRKAGFHLTFARINRDSLAWQKKLVPLQQAMEANLAALIGSPYRARKVTFHLPDFIDIVLNAGDDRDPFGATIGQSLPNWGPVANEGRGRTVAMSNLYTDPDSRAIRRKQAESLLVRASLSDYPPDAGPSLLNTILHEATHNFGPAHEYRVGGKKDTEIFGGPLASTLEELKAQTGALYFVSFLVKRGVISAALARQTYTDAFLWTLGHISRGMFTASGRPRPYSQLAAIQVGYLLERSAVGFDPKAQAANGRDRGAFTLHPDRFAAAIHDLMRIVGRIKARGDKAGAQALIARYVTSRAVPHALIKARMLRYPKASFVYGLRL